MERERPFYHCVPLSLNKNRFKLLTSCKLHVLKPPTSKTGQLMHQQKPLNLTNCRSSDKLSDHKYFSGWRYSGAKERSIGRLCLLLPAVFGVAPQCQWERRREGSVGADERSLDGPYRNPVNVSPPSLPPSIQPNHTQSPILPPSLPSFLPPWASGHTTRTEGKLRSISLCVCVCVWVLRVLLGFQMLTKSQSLRG